VQTAADGGRGAVAHEHRRSTRLRTLYGGKIVFRDGSCSFNCLVRDMAEGGARIAVDPEQLVPRRFYLVTSKHSSAFDAEIVWRRGALLGLKLHNPISLSGSDFIFLKNVWAELQPRESSEVLGRQKSEGALSAPLKPS
jgi:hypothetical protein